MYTICEQSLLKAVNFEDYLDEMCKRLKFCDEYFKDKVLNLFSANFTKWSNTLKQFVGNLPTNCLSVFDHFVGLAPKGLRSSCRHCLLLLIAIPSKQSMLFAVIAVNPLSLGVRKYISEVIKLLKLLIVVHEKNNISERLFSVLRRLYAYIHTNMSQCRLRNTMPHNVYKEIPNLFPPTILPSSFFVEIYFWKIFGGCVLS